MNFLAMAGQAMPQGYGMQGYGAPQQQGGGNTPMPLAQDPRSQYLAQAIAAMGQGADAPKTGMAAGSDLLAEALDRYALSKRQSQMQQQAYGRQLGQDFGALQGQNQAFANGLTPADLQGPNIIAGF